MKKLLTIFILTIIPALSCAAELQPSLSEDLVLDSDGYARFGTCAVVSGTKCDNDHDILHIGNTGKCYISDDDGKEKYCSYHRVCILGLSEEKEYSQRAINGCAGAWTGSLDGDVWKVYDEKIPDCKNYPKKTGKTPAFLTTENKILTDESGKIAKSAVFVNSSSFDTLAKGDLWKKLISCVAYVCADAEGKYIQGNTCSDSTKSGNLGVGTPSQTNNKHRGTAQGYLNSLANYCGTMNSK